MRAVNLLALLLLCALAGVFYGWSALEGGLERHRRGSPPPEGGSHHRGLPADPSAKTFRALLAVPRLGAGLGARNLTGKRDPGDGGPVEDGVFWSRWLEDLRPAGFQEDHARAWQARARAQRIVKLDPGCGRISNRLATFADGSRACVRYGINADQVQGEALTYHLAGLLGIPNLPPLALSRVDADSPQWAAVRARVGGLQWGERPVVSLTEWVSNLTGVVAPAPLRPGGGGLQPELLELRELRGRGEAELRELRELLQWSDLVALDFLTANFDRLASNLFSLQWDARAMERDTHNLLRTPRGELLFVDNEAGLVHGFRVLGMWEKYHSAVLGSVCVFRRRTARRVEELHRRGDCGKRLLELYRAREPLSAELGFLSDEHAALLQDRIGRLHRHVLRCREKYGGP